MLVDYIKAGTLAADTGATVLVLFIIDKDARWPIPIKAAFASTTSAGVEIDGEVSPAYELVRASIAKRPLPSFPGILFVERLGTAAEPVYLSFTTISAVPDVREQVRVACSLAEAAVLEGKSPGKSFAVSLAVQLAKKDLRYVHGGPASAWERMYNVLNALRPYKDIVAAVGKAVGGSAGKELAGKVLGK